MAPNPRLAAIGRPRDPVHSPSGPLAWQGPQPAHARRSQIIRTHLSSRTTPSGTTSATGFRVFLFILILGVLGRTLVASRGWFYWDDLTLQSQARLHPAPDPGLLFTGHDGHLMPAAWFLEWLLAHQAPLNWPVAVMLLAALHAVAALAVGWASRVLCPGGFRAGPLQIPWAGVPLLIYLLTPLTLSSGTWLAAAVNALPLHAGLAMMLGHAVLWLRRRATSGGGNPAHLLAVLGWFLLALLFNERALLLGPMVVFTLCCFLLARPGLLPPLPHRRKVKSGLLILSAAVAVPTLGWTLLYLRLLGSPRAELPPPGGDTAAESGFLLDLLVQGYVHSLLPTVAGGPWRWERWHPGPPIATPGTLVIMAGGVALLGLLIWTARKQRRLLLIWLPMLLYPLLPLLGLLMLRSGPDTAAEITRTLRHFSEVAVLGVLALAVALSHRQQSPRPLAVVPLMLFLLSSLLSTLSYTTVWADQPARTYFTNLRSELAERGEPILDQAVPLEVLLPVVHPQNQLSHLLPGATTPATPDPVLVAADGLLIDAVLNPSRATLPGQEAGCGTRIPTQGEVLPLDGPLLERDWVLQFNYFAERPGSVELALEGEPVSVALEAGLNQVFVSLVGGGDSLQVTPAAGVGEFCVADSQIGILLPERG